MLRRKEKLAQEVEMTEIKVQSKLNLGALTFDLIVYICMRLAPQDIETLMLVCRHLKRGIVQNSATIWEYKFRQHFPRSAEQPVSGWHTAFVKMYKESYSELSLRSKWLITWSKEGDIESLKTGRVVSVKNHGLKARLGIVSKIESVKVAPLSFNDLYEQGTMEFGLILMFMGTIATHQNQAVMDYIYSMILKSKKAELAVQPAIALNADTNEWQIHFASSLNQSDDVVRLIVNERAAVDVTTSSEMTALHCASLCGHTASVKSLLDNGANFNCVDELGKTPLHDASRYGHLAVVDMLLDKKGVVIDAIQSSGFTALYYATYHGHASVVKALLEKGADVNASFHGRATALYVAASFDKLEIVKMLLAHGANVHLLYRDAKPIDIAIHLGFYKVALTLYLHEVEQRADDHYRHIGFFSQPAGVKKIAARALHAVVFEGSEIDTLATHLPALQNGDLGKIFSGLGFSKKFNGQIVRRMCK